MEISIKDTFYDIVKQEPKLRALLVAYGFEPMKSNATFETVGRVITMEKALAHINKSVEDVNQYLQEKGLEVTFYESK